jgi:two-component system cell cycle response regulator
VPRITRRAFTDLAIWMVGCGLLAGLIFPFFVIPLGVPPSISIQPLFFAATFGAGLCVGVINFALARLTVGRRVRQLAEHMGDVEQIIETGTFSGDWSACDPARCRIPVDSDDELGSSAQAFNSLLEALRRSHEIDGSVRAFAEALTSQLELPALARQALDRIVVDAGAEGGAVLVMTDGQLLVAAERGLAAQPALAEQAEVTKAALGMELVRLSEPSGISLRDGEARTAVRELVIVPFAFHGEELGAIVLASAYAFDPAIDPLLRLLRTYLAIAIRNALAHARLEQLGAVDTRTGAYTEGFGRMRLEEEVARARRLTADLAVVAFDVLDFDHLVKTYGGLMAERGLATVSSVARRVLRGHDVLVHAGGERFWAVLVGAGEEDAHRIAAELRARVGAEPLLWRGRPYAVEIAVGVARLPADGIEAVDLLESARGRVGKRLHGAA